MSASWHCQTLVAHSIQVHCQSIKAYESVLAYAEIQEHLADPIHN